MISNLFQHKTPQGITHTSNRKMGAHWRRRHCTFRFHPFNFCWAFDKVDVHEEEDEEDKRKHISGNLYTGGLF